ncbi:Anion exchange transporter, partial [Dissostichus eleginoides]
KELSVRFLLNVSKAELQCSRRDTQESAAQIPALSRERKRDWHVFLPRSRTHYRPSSFPCSQLGLDSTLPLASPGHLECNVPAPLVPCQPLSLHGPTQRLQAQFVRVKALLCVQ